MDMIFFLFILNTTRSSYVKLIPVVGTYLYTEYCIYIGVRRNVCIHTCPSTHSTDITLRDLSVLSVEINRSTAPLGGLFMAELTPTCMSWRGQRHACMHCTALHGCLCLPAWVRLSLGYTAKRKRDACMFRSH
jgi:hypothetical protein